MPWMTLRSRPGTGAGHRRQSLVVEEPSRGKVSTDAINDKPVGPLHRLSLRFPQSHDGDFAELTQEPKDSPKEESDQEQEPVQDAEESSAEPDPVEQPAAVVETRTSEAGEPVEAERTPFHPVKPQRFSLLKFRHASDPQLSSTFRRSVAPAVPDLPPPTIITTSPTTNHLDPPAKKAHRTSIFSRDRKTPRQSRSRDRLKASLEIRPGSTQSLITPSTLSLANVEKSSEHNTQVSPHLVNSPDVLSPPAYGDETNSALALPVTRFSESSKSDGSSEGPRVYAQTTTTHVVSTTTTFFRLPRRKKDKGPLFPLPPKVTPSASGPSSQSQTPRHSTNDRKSISPERRPTADLRRTTLEANTDASPFPSPFHSTTGLQHTLPSTIMPPFFRKESTMSTRSGASTPSITLAPPRLGTRGRSSTLGSVGKSVEALSESSPVTASGRTSTSTTGRKSFGDIFSMHRLRQNSEPPARYAAGASLGTLGSKSNSMQIPREPEPELVYPERDDADTPTSYLEKLEAAVSRGAMATILCKGSDDFSKTCLRKYMRGFAYFGDSLDMAVRKMLMEVILPKETQQIDRLLAGFADRYHECNPGIFVSPDETGIVAFSILLLHSDTHNKNNKRKMSKLDYAKNTQGPVQISADILDCFYDNVCYTPFIHFEDDVAIHSHRLSAPKSKRSLIKTKSTESLRGPVDPYTLILDNKLSVLRPSLKEVMASEDNYNCTGTLPSLDVKIIHESFVKSGILQIVSARSRPDAFLNQATISNPAEAQAGIVNIKVAKVGLLWRKDAKKKKAKRPWQEWGAILTDSKLYFFRDVGWTKKLISQAEAHAKPARKRGPLVFNPPLSSFEPDALMSMDDAAALTDSSYKKHKNAFVFIKHGGFEEVFLANSESDMNDWMGKLNYAATFRTAGVRMRGMVGSPNEGERFPMRRKDSQLSTLSHESHHQDTAAAPSRPIDPQMAWEILYYRRQIINEKLSDYDEKLANIQKELDNLLRNARHLQILLPIQPKTREVLILAAGRMSAKLKWTRIELWRTKCHRDLLKADLELESISDFPAPKSVRSSKTLTPLKDAPQKPTAQTLTPGDIGDSTIAVSPLSIPSTEATREPSQIILDHVKTSDSAQDIMSEKTASSIRRSLLSVDGAPVNHGFDEEHSISTGEKDPDSHALHHQPSIVSSHRSKTGSDRHLVSADDNEDTVRTVSATEGISSTPRRPDTSGSERDRVGAISPEMSNRDRGGSVRRSLQRTLRDSQHGHHLAGHRYSKKGRDSGSSFVTADEGSQLASTENELKRGTGSFLLHGKKASVVTFGSEWNEERMKLRPLTKEDAKAESDADLSTFRKPGIDETSMSGGAEIDLDEHILNEEVKHRLEVEEPQEEDKDEGDPRED